MSKLFLRAALVGAAAAGAAVAQTPTAPPPIHVAPPVPTLSVRATPTVPAEMVSAEVVLKTYDLGDLVCPPADSPLAKPGTDKAMIAAARAYTDARATEVFKTIYATTGCHPKTMELTSDGKTLVVRNTAAVVEKVGPCVAAVRQAHSSQVMVEVVLVSVPSGHAAVGKLFGDKLHASLSTAEVKALMVQLKESGSVDVLCHPQMVVLNKQTGFCQVAQPVPVVPCEGGKVQTVQTVGTTARVTPEVSADLKTLVLAVEVEHSAQCGRGVNYQTAKMNVVMPDGGSMAMKVGTQKTERKIESKVPVVGDLPYVGRLFHSIALSSEPTDVVAVVTATRLTEPRVMAHPPVAVCPQPLPAAPVPVTRPFVAPLGVALPPPVRAVAADGLERVGVSFNTLTSPPTAQSLTGWVVDGQRVVLPRGGEVRVVALPGRDFVRFTTHQWTAAAVSAIGVAEVPKADDTTALMASYHAACAAGHKDEAAKLAVQLLAKDPTCFGKK